MLHSVAELAGDGVGNVDRVLGDEIHADTFRPNQPHDLFNLLQQRLGRIVEQQMRFIKKEAQHRLVGVANLWEVLKQLAQQPQQKGGIELGALHQLGGGKHVDDAPALVITRNEIGHGERGFTKEMFAALRAELQQRSLDCADAGL